MWLGQRSQLRCAAVSTRSRLYPFAHDQSAIDGIGLAYSSHPDCSLFLIGRRLRKLSRKTQDRVADTGARAVESLGAIQTVQAFTHEDEDRAHFASAVEAAFDAAIQRVVARSYMQAVIGGLGYMAVILVIWVGANMVLAEAMSVGDLFAFIGFALILAFGVAMLGEVWSEVQRPPVPQNAWWSFCQ